MAKVEDHYDEHLGPIYEWMAGPFETACGPSTRLFEELDLKPGETGIAIDLGCGHGLQTLPLARLGYRVVAIDLCNELLAGLVARCDAYPIEAIHADIMEFEQHAPAQVDLAICMGDTLTHLPSLDDVKVLIGRVAAVLVPGGAFVATVRDYVSSPLEGDGRFIPVRSDEDRILTCYLEYFDQTVRVHDIVYERSPSGWKQSVSSYEKLRIAPQWLADVLRESGLEIVLERAERGLLTFAARSVG